MMKKEDGVMANRLHVAYIKSTALDEKGNEKHTTYGFHIADDYDTKYCDIFETFEELTEYLNEKTILNVLDVFWSASNTINGLYFNGKWKDIEELEKIREKRQSPDDCIAC